MTGGPAGGGPAGSSGMGGGPAGRVPRCSGTSASPAAPVVPLASLVRGEAVRGEAAGRIRPDPARLAAGWERRFVIERARAADLARLYEGMGLEVALDPVAPELLEDDCTDCRLVSALDYVTLYTRKPGGAVSTPSSG